VVREEEIFGKAITPEELVESALSCNSRSIAYTYTEPTIYFELMLETAKLAKKEGLKNVMVTNGYMSPEALEEIQPYIDGANIDLKAFNDDFYKTYCGARIEPVKETIGRMSRAGIWVELTTLLIPGLNDGGDEIQRLTDFIAGVDPAIPWHVSRFFPQHQLTDTPITPEDSIYHCLETGKEKGIQYLYAGNIPGDRWAHTHCHHCGTLLIKRSGYSTRVIDMDAGKCGNCRTAIPGIWK
jgi:pyruvate formate lyase activating enzyme